MVTRLPKVMTIGCRDRSARAAMRSRQSAPEELDQHRRDDLVGHPVPLAGQAAVLAAGSPAATVAAMPVRSSLLPSLSSTSVGTVTEANSCGELASLSRASYTRVCATDTIADQAGVGRIPASTSSGTPTLVRKCSTAASGTPASTSPTSSAVKAA